MVGAIPAAYGWSGGEVSLDTYFAMARGAQGAAHDHACAHGHAITATAVPAQEMTKWFDTNYHYMVPEFTRGQTFALSSHKPVDEFREAKALGYQTRPVLLGPVTFLQARQEQGCGARSAVAARRAAAGLCRRAAPARRRRRRLGAARRAVPGARPRRRDARGAAHRLRQLSPRALPALKIMLTTYFGGIGDNLDTALSLPVAGLHVDLVRAPEQLDDDRGEGAAGPGAVARRDRRPQRLARRPAGAARSPGARGGEARHRPCAGRAVLLAAARADRSRARDAISIRS